MLVTAGPTHEPIDAVRYIGNRSSGRTGLAIANAAAERGLPTTLLLGPIDYASLREGLPQDSHVRVIRFQTTSDLERLLHGEWPNHDVLVMAAAVADYRPKRRGDGVADAPAGKLRRRDVGLTLELESTPDLLAGLAGMTRPDQCVIGFALEPREALLDTAIEKMSRKHLDAIVANPLETMGSDVIEAIVLLRDGRQWNLTPHGPAAKNAFAAALVDRILATRREVPASRS
jgi:phosphopantothenoylcysteine decarboxylase/phosphopantothenate--cysteine ligase